MIAGSCEPASAADLSALICKAAAIHPGIADRLQQTCQICQVLCLCHADKVKHCEKPLYSRSKYCTGIGYKHMMQVSVRSRLIPSLVFSAVLQSARETLENAIRMVEASDKWKARVVYGDTDSMFVLLPGRSACTPPALHIHVSTTSSPRSCKALLGRLLTLLCCYHSKLSKPTL